MRFIFEAIAHYKEDPLFIYVGHNRLKKRTFNSFYGRSYTQIGHCGGIFSTRDRLENLPYRFA